LFNATLQIDVDIEDVEEKSSFTVLDSTGKSTVYEVPYNRSGKVNVTIQYYYNFAALGNPYVFTLEKGNHIITLHYPINNIGADSINRFDVQMSADSGNVSVNKEMFMGTISGQGLAGKPRWDGTITVEEPINFVSTYTMDVAKYNDQLNITKPIRDHGSDMLSDRVRPVSTYTMGVLGFESTLGSGTAQDNGFNFIVTNYTFEVAKKDIYEYDRDIVLVTDTYQLRQNYEYTSTDKYIDYGTMASVVIQTTDKTSVESVEIVDSREAVN
jgi:hypothetical protein